MGTGHGSVHQSTDTCFRLLQVLLLALMGTAFAFYFMASASCEFVIVKGEIESRRNATISNVMERLAAAAPTSPGYRLHSAGLFRFADPDNEDVCWVWPNPAKDEFGWRFRTARWGMLIGCILTGLALLALLLEFTLCRFVCGRCFITICVLGGFCGLAMSGLVYTSGQCGPLSGNYACDYGRGTVQALFAATLMVVGLIVSCCTPKSTPLARLIREQDRRTPMDAGPCCCGMSGDPLAFDEGDGNGYDDLHRCWRHCCRGKSEYEVYKDNPELLLRQMPADEVDVDARIKGGGTIKATFPHYWDDQAGGVTLQSQYTAACQRYLECEKNYQNTLDRFKQECRDDEDGAREYSEASKKSSHGHWRQILTTPPEKIEDPEQARLVGVLDTLNGNSRQAKLVMDRIESDLAELMKPPEQKIEEALRKLEEEEEAKKHKVEKARWWAKGKKKSLTTLPNPLPKDSPQEEESPQIVEEAMPLQASSYRETSYPQSMDEDSCSPILPMVRSSVSSNASPHTMIRSRSLNENASALEEMAFLSARMESHEAVLPRSTSSDGTKKRK